VATIPGVVPEMESTDQPEGESDLSNLGPLYLSTALPYICADNVERSCSSPAIGGTYT